MQADLSRLTFRPAQRYSAVLAQQGMVQLDADANEQVLIQLHTARTTAADLIGEHGGPSGRLGFGIEFVPKGQGPADLRISAGHYYVHGIPVDADRPAAATPVPEETGEPADTADTPAGWTYWDQPDAFRDPTTDDLLPDGGFLAYLKVSEQLVTSVRDPKITESALGTALPDTTARVKVTWQVLPLKLDLGRDPSREQLASAFHDWVESRRSTGRLAARTERPTNADDNPCLVAPDARYRGPENQLYRVEVHADGERPTFKWSRENGSVIFGISAASGAWVTLTGRGRDGKLDLDIGDWVEVVDDALEARRAVAPLLQVMDIDTERLRIELSGEVEPMIARHPFLRRWDHRAPSGRGAPRLVDGALPIAEGRWLAMEDGVQVWFADGGTYHNGDYWTFAARTLTGDVEWPRDERSRPLLVEPDGVYHHYAPLAWVPAGGTAVTDLRRKFDPLAR